MGDNKEINVAPRREAAHPWLTSLPELLADATQEQFRVENDDRWLDTSPVGKEVW